MSKTKCDNDVFLYGKPVAIANGDPSFIERLVNGLKSIRGAKADWHYVGGRGVIKALGDADKVRRELKKEKGESGSDLIILD